MCASSFLTEGIPIAPAARVSLRPNVESLAEDAMGLLIPVLTDRVDGAHVADLLGGSQLLNQPPRHERSVVTDPVRAPRGRGEPGNRAVQ